MKLLRTSTIPGSLDTFCKGLLKELSDEGYEVVAVSSPGEEMETINRREGVRTVAVSMQRHISPLNDLKSLWKLICLFRKEKPDIVHSITPKAGLLSMIAAWICRVPVRLHTFTGLIFPTATGLTQKILILTDRITCACATHIVPEGEGVKADLIRYHITKKPLRVLGYGNIRGIDLAHYDPSILPAMHFDPSKADNPIPVDPEAQVSSPFTFIFIGRLVRDKGINELIEAFGRLNALYPATQLILVGRAEADLDPLLHETEAAIASNPAIHAVGRQSDVRPWLMSSDALVFPSYREGFPNVVIEAGAMGLPSIVTDINGSREIIIPDKNGVIVPTHDADSLFEAMKTFVENPDKIRAMAEKARPLISSRYEQSFVRQCLKDYYKEIIPRNKK